LSDDHRVHPEITSISIEGFKSIKRVKDLPLRPINVLIGANGSVVDHFEPEDVLVADRVDGRTELQRLEQDRLARWLQDYSLGELWQKNELGGRPAPEALGKDRIG